MKKELLTMVCKFRAENRTFPANCLECQDTECNLPGMLKVRKQYYTRRHPKCPLVELTDEEVALVEQILATAKKRNKAK